MSQRSILEINHDLSHIIERHPGAIEDWLKIALASGSDQAWAPLEKFGIRRITQCHHSEDRKIVVGNREYPFG